MSSESFSGVLLQFSWFLLSKMIACLVFIWEKLRSTYAVPTGIERDTVTEVGSHHD
jgi:hypothetical protein